MQTDTLMWTNGRVTQIGNDTPAARRHTPSDWALDELYDVWPDERDRQYYHPYHDCKRIAEDFEHKQQVARDYLLPQYKDLGDERDDPGALSIYERHRIVERQIADKLYNEVAPYAELIEANDLAYKVRRAALKMYDCRTSGGFGIGPAGKPIILWDTKCSCSKLCPDEARHEGQRLFDQYADPIVQHEREGGRVYKAWFTLPNYPGGRLNEGQSYMFRRFRNKVMRAVKNGEQKFGIEGALVVLEAPLSEARDWNVHVNVILLAKGWLSYKNLRDAWGYNVEIRQHSKFDEKGMQGLFNEMFKYAVRTTPEKSISKSQTDAPAFIDWTPDEVLEWFDANRNFRRTRTYGILFGIGKPDRSHMKPGAWLGAVHYGTSGYRIIWRDHSLGHYADTMLKFGRHGLDLIRGDKSTENRRFRHGTGPP